jgi:hypothetical protein
MIDKVYCCSSYLMYRTIADHSMQFREGVTPHFFSRFKEQPDQIHDSYELENSLRKSVEKMFAERKRRLRLAEESIRQFLQNSCLMAQPPII